ncbi:hypothetical protein Tco_1187511 [Tanacetum coccineum]
MSSLPIVLQDRQSLGRDAQNSSKKVSKAAAAKYHFCLTMSRMQQGDDAQGDGASEVTHGVLWDAMARSFKKYATMSLRPLVIAALTSRKDTHYQERLLVVVSGSGQQ